MINSDKRLNSLQALRAMAAMLVCFCHLPFSLKLYSTHYDLPYDDRLVFLDSFFNSGVDIFFVISGFIMTYVVANKNIDIQFCINFAKKRIIRIFPMYWAVLTAYCVYALIFGSNVIQSYSQVLGAYFLIPGYRIMPLSWTLTFEMLFYAVFTLSLLFATRLMTKSWLAIGMITGYYFLSFLFPEATDRHSIFQNPIIYEFVLGLLIAKLYFKNKFLSKPYALLGVFAYILVVIWNTYDPIIYSSHTYSWGHLVRWGFTSALLVYSFLSLEHAGVFFPNLLLKIGNSSYSLYLLNSVLMVFFVKFWIKLDLPPMINPYWMWLVLLLLVIVCAHYAYQLLEKTMLKALTNRFVEKDTRF